MEGMAEDQPRPRIVVGIDGSLSSSQALRWALREAALTGSALDAVIAWEDPGFDDFRWLVGSGGYAGLAAQTLGEVVSVARPAGCGVTIRERVIRGEPADVLVRAAEGANLLVVGSCGGAGFAALPLGSVCRQCVKRAPCPVMVVRGFAATAGRAQARFLADTVRE